MISRADLKWIQSLSRKAARDKEALFVAEGSKVVGELMGNFDCVCLLSTEKALQSLPTYSAQRIEIMPEDFDFARISRLDSPRDLVAVFRQPQYPLPPVRYLSGLSLMLDRVQDPGNLGSIIRSAAWFGVQSIFLASGTADPFGPKVVQATMGALAQTKLIPLGEPEDFLRELREEDIPVYGTFLNGPSLKEATLPPTCMDALLLMGNEGKGIRPELAAFCNQPLYIPHAPNPAGHPESLNVSVATAIILYQWQSANDRLSC